MENHILSKKTVTTNYPGTVNPYYGYREYILKRFGQRVQKVSVDAGFTCPNRDGTKGFGGCIYCNNNSFTPGYLNGTAELIKQIDEGQDFLRRRYKAEKFIVYFQANTNTYAPLDELKKLYETALSQPDVLGLAIGTRPDCVDKELLNYLETLAKHRFISLEYGLESAHDNILTSINRGHTVNEYKRAVELTAGRNICIGTHIILGLPGETKAMMLDGAYFISSLPVDFLKIHHLHIVENTALARKFKEKPFKTFTIDEYIPLVSEFISRLSPYIILQRVAGETHPRNLIAPKWGLRINRVTEMVINHMNKNSIIQGMNARYKSDNCVKNQSF